MVYAPVVQGLRKGDENPTYTSVWGVELFIIIAPCPYRDWHHDVCLKAKSEGNQNCCVQTKVVCDGMHTTVSSSFICMLVRLRFHLL